MTPFKLALPLLLLLTLLLSALASSPALAQDRPRAVTEEDEKRAGELFQKGQAEANAQNYKAAAALFAEAWLLDPDPILAFNAGRAFENDGDPRARKYYQLALASNPSDEVRKHCESSLNRLDRAEALLKEQLDAARPTTAALSITANITGADVYIDDTPQGQLPMTLTLTPGAHRVEIRHPGYHPYFEEIAAEAGEQLAVVAELEEKPLISWVGWTGLGLMVVGAGVGGSGVIYQGDARDAHDQAQTLEAKRDPALFDQLRTDGEASKTTAQILYGSGITLGAVGMGMLIADLLSDDAEPPPPAPGDARLLLAPGQATVEIRW